ncbi:hypothetical protein A3770_10p57420 [Chloropicon primus]|uniref:Vacuolar protein 8 n=1 Tax=Chloropicon primus TaxID=1764295 RepID=A0A5B8MTZ3_9CHLO|nr:hypothetical protein A3770_10p57420 [Chloropicon primus]|eukprot:QDZ23224.1 hypothetical protein A3770_10p57420 [Chloropicon primus]
MEETKMTLDRALAELEASKTRGLERAQGELRELNSALSHFEESHREELELHGNVDTATTKRRLTRAKLERALAEEQEAHRATRRQLELYKLAAAEATQTKASGSKEGKRTKSIFGGQKSKKRGAKSAASSPFEGYDQQSDDDIPLSLEERKEEMERSSNEYKNIIVMQSEEIESLKNQLSTMTQAFEDHIPLSQLIPLATRASVASEDDNGYANGRGGGSGSGTFTSPSGKYASHGGNKVSRQRDHLDKVKIIAARTIANLAAREDRRPDIVGSLPQLLGVLHGPSTAADQIQTHHQNQGETGLNSQLQRLVCAAVANLSIDSKFQGEVVKLGGLEALTHLSRTGVDSQTLRMAAGALANLCANALLKEELTGKGIVKTLVSLLQRVSHPDVEAQVARGLANWVVSTDELGIGKVLDEFARSGGVTALLKLGENREADLTVKKQVGVAIYHTFKSFPELTKEQISKSPSGIKPLLEMKRCADKEVSELAESSLRLYEDTKV